MHSGDPGHREMNEADDQPSTSMASSNCVSASKLAKLLLHGNFQVVLRILVLEEGPDYLDLLGNILKECRFQVTRCPPADNALHMLVEKRDCFDVILGNVILFDIDAVEIHRQMNLDMGIPVITMSGDDKLTMIIDGNARDICSHKEEVLGDLLLHVVQKRKCRLRDLLQTNSPVGRNRQLHNSSEASDNASSVSEGRSPGISKRKNDGAQNKHENEDVVLPRKKRRVVWHPALHEKFVWAVNQIGIDKAVPKKILELMDEPGLTRENVASHLQKYRMHLKKLAEGSYGKTASPMSLPSKPDVYQLAGSQNCWKTSSMMGQWPQQQQTMSPDDRSFLAFPSTSMNLQMALMHRPIGPMIPGNSGQPGFSVGVAMTIPPGRNVPTPMGREETYSPVLLTPSSQGLPIMSYMESQSEEFALANDFLELQNMGFDFDEFKPEYTIPYQPQANIVPHEGTVPDMQGNILSVDNLGAATWGTFPSTALQPMYPGDIGVRGLVDALPNQQQQRGTGTYEDKLDFDGLSEGNPRG